jgi:hypothetical protein
MYGSALRAYGFGAVVSVLLGTGIGFGWHYIADSAGGRAAAAAPTRPGQEDVSNLPSPNPPAPREGQALDAPKVPDSSQARQTARHSPRKMCSQSHACRKSQQRR